MARRGRGISSATTARVRPAILRRVIGLSTFLSLGIGFGLAAASDPLLEPIIQKAEYCQGKAGSITLRLQFELRSRSATQTPLILPLFAQVSGYELFRDEAAVRRNRVESSSFHLEVARDAAKLKSSTPDPKFFRTVPAGETASWDGLVEIPVAPTRRNKPSLLGTDRYLRVHMNPWPAPRQQGKMLSELWRSQGVLWTAEVISLPIRIHIEREPKASACWMQID